MSKFEKSEWAEREHAKEFMENADIYILERKRLFAILKSFYRYFLGNNPSKRPVKVLDLGCGNAALTMELLKEDKKINATLVDGSLEMLENARENLSDYPNMNFMHKTFQELLENGSQDDDILPHNFDFVVSSLAIHHLHTEEKKSLFQYLYDHLESGGFFLNIETVKAPTDELESWYRVLWSEWIEENQVKLDVKKSFEYLPEQYKDNPDNNPDKLQMQLNALESAGFSQVDCYYKYGIFSIYGGMK
ncbi:methyltransferase domain-containing protein [Methanobacterium sp.]|uniref:methyltransferase domain-containing protein n=1 Tax=Methanobacterium sp. TaxID=2164 RepID=UPI0025E51850|nr:methyltransferase domain-containing protein [Methanobacterium sp.]MBI5459468.1 methyltransferase domain-containing protein [Methanobacterium sp.]